jgi:hypothetical protein
MSNLKGVRLVDGRLANSLELFEKSKREAAPIKAKQG